MNRTKIGLLVAGIVATVGLTGATAASATTVAPLGTKYACFFFTGTGLVANRPILRTTDTAAIADCTSLAPLYPHTIAKLKKVTQP